MKPFNPGSQFARRTRSIESSFIREILDAASNSNVISFAGGLPDSGTFPVNELSQGCQRLMENQAQDLLQYGSSLGETDLRRYLVLHYREFYGLEIELENILVTTGSQQGLDLLARTLIDPGDGVVIEAPGYLGAIQAMSFYEPNFLPVEMRDAGICIEGLAHGMKQNPKVFYSVPNFQNPTGRRYGKLSTSLGRHVPQKSASGF